MKRFLISTLALIFILFIIGYSFYLNMDGNLLDRTSKNTIISLIYLLIWGLLTYIGVKKDYIVINVFRLCIWALSLVSSIFSLIFNLDKVLPNYFKVFTISDLIINRTILKGISFSKSLIGNSIIFIIISLTFILSPMVYKLVLKFTKVKVDNIVNL